MAARLKSGDRVLYFYGISQRRASNELDQHGVDLQTQIEPVECEGLVCWISRVSPDDFEKNLERNMENLDWLATASVAHQRAISAIAEHSGILPARFGTVFRNERSLREHIRARAGAIAADFRRLGDADEWGVKVFAAQPPAVAMSPVKTGKDYLKAKAALLPKRRSRSGSNDDFADFENALQQVALEFAAVGKVSGGQRGLRFQTSLLVKRKNRAKLESVLRRFSESWAESRRIECTGPWPPYSFVSRESDR